MKTILEPETLGDAELVGRCLGKDRNAFASIITRYQSLICAIAYNACGDVGRSEDLAQDTFIAAWRNLRELKEPSKLKGWLCAIARNLVHNALRRESRAPLTIFGSSQEEQPSLDASPHEQAASKEEEALVWRALEAIPPLYREPMILFYREGQSTQAVAEALDLSEDAVSQRLSRGRMMLKESVAETVESALSRSAPGKALAAAILAALPAFTATPAKAAALSAAVAKGGAMTKTGATLGSAGSFLGMLGLSYFNVRASIEDTKSPRERQFMIRQFLFRMAMVVVFFVVIFVAQELARAHASLLQTQPWIADSVLAAGLFGFTVYAIVTFGYQNRRRRQIQIEDGTWEESEWQAPLKPGEQSWASHGSAAKAERFRYLSLGIAVLVILGLAIQKAWAGHWIVALVIAAFYGVLFLLTLRAMRRRPRYDARFATQAKSLGAWALLTLFICNYSHFYGAHATWTLDTPALILNAAIVLAYLGLYGILARQNRAESP